MYYWRDLYVGQESLVGFVHGRVDMSLTAPPVPAVMSHFAKTILHNKNYAHPLPSGRREEWPEVAQRVTGYVVTPYMPRMAPKIAQMMTDRKFIPGGRYLYSAGRKYSQFNNCFMFRAVDTREGWGELFNKTSQSLMTGGGVGVDYSPIREEGALVGGLGGHCTGPVSVAKVVNEQGRYIRQGGSRRSALWAGLSWLHKDIFQFMTAKEWGPLIKEGKRKDFNFPAPLDMTNISVILDDLFFTAYKDPSHEHHKQAHLVYWTAVEHMLRTGEPGFSVDVGDNAGETLRNACLTGDTLVATADGRGPVPIKDLVGSSTQVYATDSSGRVKIGTLRNVRVTRRQAPVVKLTLDDGTFVRLTGDHQVMLLNGSFVEAGTLVPGTRLMPFWSKVRQGYRWVGCKTKGAKACWLAMGRSGGEGDGLDVHHINEDSLDDRLENLTLLGHGKHASINMVGSRNPSSRIKGDRDWRIRKSRATTGVKNGRYVDGSSQKVRPMSILHDSIPEGRKTWAKVCVHCGEDFAAKSPAAVTCSKQCAGCVSAKDKVRSRYGREVVSVEPDGYEDVYDGEVPGLHCFAVVTTSNEDVVFGSVDSKRGTYAGMIVHNCCEVTSADSDDMCNLGSFNLARYDTLGQFAEDLDYGVAFLLCGTLASQLPIQSMYKVREKNRRLGLGLMGVHEWLLKRGKRYGPDDELGDWLEVYRRSGAIANLYCDRMSISHPAATRSIAPNGTIGIVAETTPSAEPVPYVAYKRRYLEGSEWRAQYVIDPTAFRLIQQGVDPDIIEDSVSLADDVERRIKFQAWIQGYVDHGISSTINLPPWGSSTNNETKVKSFGETLMKYLPSVRGITVYPDGARDGQPFTKVSYYDAIKRINVEFADGCERSCKSGVCGD